MVGKVGEFADTERLCAVLLHCKRVAVLEPERHANAESHDREATIDLGERRACVQLQDFGRERADVIGIDIDAARFEGGEDDAGVAEAGPVTDLPMFARHPRDDLAENVGFREALRSDDEGFRGIGTRHGERTEDCQ